ncbi:LexA family protein [Streptomyces sp. NPDC060085]|uniref:LexA family protein n=1 Tax=Streptomyces sp. NPDC060085 TaxID=3347054 RepID=UPI0036498FCE
MKTAAFVVGRQQEGGRCANPRQVVGDGDLFALAVVGDSMVDVSICDGEVLRRQDGQVWVMPRNPACQAIPGDEAQIRQGRRRPAASLRRNPLEKGRSVMPC